jgi:sugar lactone lactonase YvrE
MAFTWNTWLKHFGTRGEPRRRDFQPGIEALESRLAPAFDLTIGSGTSFGLVHNAVTGTFTANDHGSNISVADIRADLLAGKNVTISDGNTGTESGNITWLPGADLDFNGIGLGLQTLTISADPTATGGSVTMGSRILDSNPALSDTLNVSVRATRDLTVSGAIQASLGTVTLAADTKFDGTGDDGVGTLTVGSGAVVNGGGVTLRGAAVNIDTSANPATVTATNQSVVIGSGFFAPEDLVFDSQGNLFVSDQTGNNITKLTPTGQVSTFFAPSASLGLNALAIDSQNNLYATDITNGAVYKITPQANPSLFANGFSQPTGIALDAAGNVYVANYNTGAIDKVSGGQTTVFASGFNNPAGIVFDAAGNLYVNNVATGTVSKVSPDGKTITTFASGFNAPSRLVFDRAGNLFVTNAVSGVISKVTPQGQVNTFLSGFDNPHGLRFDAQGNLFVVSFTGKTVSRVGAAGTLIVQSSLSGGPIAIGGTGNAVAGINLSAAQLARLSATDVLTFGDPTQAGDITLFSVRTTTPLVQVVQNPDGPGGIVLDDTSGPGLTTNGGSVRFTSGAGGIRVTGAKLFDINAGVGTLYFNGGGNVGSLLSPLHLNADFLGSGDLNGTLFLADPVNLTTIGQVIARSIFLTLGGDFTTHTGDLVAGSVELVLDGSNLTQHLNSGGQVFCNVMPEGFGNNTTPYLFQLVNSPLNVSANFIEEADFDANGQVVTVSGQTFAESTYLASSGPQNFLGGLTVDGLFKGGTGPVTAGGLVIASGAIFTAPSTTLTDTGDFTNMGTTFDANGGTVVLSGTNQHINGSIKFNYFTKSVTVSDTLTLQSHTTQTVTGSLILQGANGQPLRLRSSSLGQSWAFAPQGGLTVFNLDVQDGTDLFLSAGNAVYTLLTGAALADVSLQADVALGSSGVQYSGLVARYSGPGESNLYWGALVGNNGQFFADIFRNINGVWTQLAGAPVASGTSTLRFDVVGSSLKLYLNNVLATSATDSALISGTAGVRSDPAHGASTFVLVQVV